MNKAVFCIAQNIDQAENIVNSLKFAGFSNNDISVLLPDKSGTRTSPTKSTLRHLKALPLGGCGSWRRSRIGIVGWHR